jgi:arginine-tRNA-protein transferase
MKIYNYTEEPEELKPEDFDDYLARGWYRMYQNLFTVTHWLNGDSFEMDRVWWLRYDAGKINVHPSHKKILKRAGNFIVTVECYPEIPQEDHDLYARYRSWIDFDGYDSLSKCLYNDEDNLCLFDTWAVSVRDGERLIAKGLMDLGANAVMAKVSFYDPEYIRFSPGKLLMLLEVQFMREQGFQWYYPGYVIVGRPKFDYKLFLGRETAEYFDPETENWKPFCNQIMEPEIRTADEEIELIQLFIKHWM